MGIPVYCEICNAKYYITPLDTEEEEGFKKFYTFKCPKCLEDLFGMKREDD